MKPTFRIGRIKQTEHVLFCRFAETRGEWILQNWKPNPPTQKDIDASIRLAERVVQMVVHELDLFSPPSGPSP